MANITLSVPDDLHKKMKHFSEIRWSEIARGAIEERVKTLEQLDQIASKSKLSEGDILEFSKRLKSIANKRFAHANSN
jgi:hypothetical protein